MGEPAEPNPVQTSSPQSPADAPIGPGPAVSAGGVGGGAGAERKSIMRSLGEFFGHIAHAVRTDPANPAPPAGPASSAARDVGGEGVVPAANRHVTRQTVEEEERETPRGKVTLRRTIIEEVELPPPLQDGGDAGAKAGG